jgi:hypothetical protein
LRRYERRTFASMPISSARALGVMVSDEGMVPLSVGNRGVRFITLILHGAAAHVNPTNVWALYGVCKGGRLRAQGVKLRGTPPTSPPRWPLTFWSAGLRGLVRASCVIFGGLRLATYEVHHAS